MRGRPRPSRARRRRASRRDSARTARRLPGSRRRSAGCPRRARRRSDARRWCPWRPTLSTARRRRKVAPSALLPARRLLRGRARRRLRGRRGDRGTADGFGRTRSRAEVRGGEPALDVARGRTYPVAGAAGAARLPREDLHLGAVGEKARRGRAGGIRQRDAARAVTGPVHQHASPDREDRERRLLPRRIAGVRLREERTLRYGHGASLLESDGRPARRTPSGRRIATVPRDSDRVKFSEIRPGWRLLHPRNRATISAIMLVLRRDLTAWLARQRAVALPETPPRAGLTVDHHRAVLGRGRAVYQRAQDALRRWKMFDLGWVE